MKLPEQYEALEAKVWYLEHRLKDAQDIADRLAQALRFYADADNYRLNGYLDPNSGNFTGQNTALEVLSAYEATRQQKVSE